MRAWMVIVGTLAGCAPEWEACETEDAEGEPICVEYGSPWQESEKGFDSCEDVGGTVLEGACADNGFSCPGQDEDGQFWPDAACAAAG